MPFVSTWIPAPEDETIPALKELKCSKESDQKTVEKIIKEKNIGAFIF